MPAGSQTSLTLKIIDTEDGQLACSPTTVSNNWKKPIATAEKLISQVFSMEKDILIPAGGTRVLEVQISDTDDPVQVDAWKSGDGVLYLVYSADMTEISVEKNVYELLEESIAAAESRGAEQMAISKRFEDLILKEVKERESMLQKLVDHIDERKKLNSLEDSDTSLSRDDLEISEGFFQNFAAETTNSKMQQEVANGAIRRGIAWGNALVYLFGFQCGVLMELVSFISGGWF